MTNYISQPKPQGLFKLAGKISNYRKERGSASFVFTESDQTGMGVIAVASSLAGLPGQAAIMAHHAASLEEEADFLEFELDGHPVKGWLWRSPFAEGDLVEAAVEKREGHYELFGMAKPDEKVIALYPHCSRGRVRHTLNAMKWWVILVAFIFGGMSLMPLIHQGKYPWQFWGETLTDYRMVLVTLGLLLFLMLMVWALTRKWMPFVKLAEKVFRTLELPAPSSVDLVKSSKVQKRQGDPPECGHFYFKY